MATKAAKAKKTGKKVAAGGGLKKTAKGLVKSITGGGGSGTKRGHGPGYWARKYETLRWKRKYQKLALRGA